MRVQEWAASSRARKSKVGDLLSYAVRITQSAEVAKASAKESELSSLLKQATVALERERAAHCETKKKLEVAQDEFSRVASENYRDGLTCRKHGYRMNTSGRRTGMVPTR